MQRTSTRRPVSLIAGSLVALALSASPAVAVELTPSLGSICVAGKNDASKINYSNQWGVQNENTGSSAKVHCPVLFDWYEFDQNPSIQLNVVDQHSSSNVSCTLTGVNPYNGDVGYSVTKSTSGSSSSSMSLDYFDVPNFISYVATCTLPVSVSGKHSRVLSVLAAHLD